MPLPSPPEPTWWHLYRGPVANDDTGWLVWSPGSQGSDLYMEGDEAEIKFLIDAANEKIIREKAWEQE